MSDAIVMPSSTPAVQSRVSWAEGVLMVLLLACELLPVSFGSVAVVMIAFFVLVGTLRIRKNLLRIVWPLFFIVLLGVIYMSRNMLNHILRDIAYSFVPISALFLGEWLGKRLPSEARYVRIVTICAILLSMLQLGTIAIRPDVWNANVETFRKEIGAGYTVVPISLFILLFRRRYGLSGILPSWIPYAPTIILLLAALISFFSRSYIVFSVIFCLSLLGIVGRVNLRFMVYGALIACLLVGLVMSTSGGNTDSNSVRGKISRGLSELVVSDYAKMNDINENYRGFETYRAILTFLSGTTAQQLVGQGFGATVDLGFFMPLGDTELDKIPVLHNGYAYLAIKTGILGLCFCMLFFFKCFLCGRRYGFSGYLKLALYGRIIIGCTLGLAATTLVVGGLYESAKFVPMTITLGYFLSLVDYGRRSL